MSVSFIRQSSRSRSYSSRSISSASAVSMSGGMQLIGAGHKRISTGAFLFRPPSVYGGAGGHGTRISHSHSVTLPVFSSGSLTPYVETAVINNEKVMMQNLNDRLASYLDTVHSLEAANSKLELQIREHYGKTALTVSKDFTKYFTTIAELRDQIATASSENQRILLQVDNTQIAAADFKIKYEMELRLHMVVQNDLSHARGTRDSLTLSICELEGQIESLKQELVCIKSNHEEEMQQFRIQQTGTVNVEVDNAESEDLTKVLEEMREQYEAVMLKNKLELEKWLQSKVETIETQIVTCTKDVKTFYTQLSELKRTYQSLEIARHSISTEIKCLQKNEQEVKSQYSVQLSQVQLTINTLEIELQQLKVSLEHQQAEYNMLLDIKMRLEAEITEYRRLLEGELHEQFEEKKAVVISKVVEVEVKEHKPHIEKRVKTIVEEIVDGKVVSSSVETQVMNIQ